ncbi:MAG: hypothetical protein VX923_03170 [Pseudomonadota bacterium]|nr:hypothetical protein [Pseudomonadota bacterium]
MRILQIESGLFPDEETIHKAIERLNEGEHDLSQIDISALKVEDNTAWDLVVKEILMADLVVTV